MKISFRGGRIIDPLKQTDLLIDLHIADQQILAVGAPPAGFVPDQEINVSGRLILPGLVDLCLRLREPGQEFRNAIESETRAAVAGGITSLLCPPDTEPVLDEPGLVEMLSRRVQGYAPRIYPAGALTRGLSGSSLSEMAELSQHGCIAFSQADVPIPDTEVLWRALQYAHTYNFLVILRPEDGFLAAKGLVHEGAMATRLGLQSIPAMAESIGLLRILELVRYTGARVHLSRLSTARAVELIRTAKQEGLPITCDVAVHHLHCTDADIGYFNSNSHVIPPFRGESDKTAIRQGLTEGVIDAICSDHAPLDPEQKALPLGEALPGVTSAELMLLLCLKWAQEERIPIPKAVAKVSQEPARILGLTSKGIGSIQAGATADLVIVDPEAFYLVEPHSLCSQGKNTPFMGYELPGRIEQTWVAGTRVYP